MKALEKRRRCVRNWLNRRGYFLSVEDRMAALDACLDRQRELDPEAPIEVRGMTAWAEHDAEMVPPWRLSFWTFWR